MAELWNKRDWKKNNDICKDWMFDENSDAFLGEKHDNVGVTLSENAANPPWAIPDCGLCGDLVCWPARSEPGEILKDPLKAFPEHFKNLNIEDTEYYMYNPYLADGK